MSLTVYLGIDVGSVTTKLALVDEKGKYVDSYMLRTAGKPVLAVQTGLKKLYEQKLTDYDVMGVGTTGSGRNLAGALVCADVIKNEITAHAVAASINVPGVQTILENPLSTQEGWRYYHYGQLWYLQPHYSRRQSHLTSHR